MAGPRTPALLITLCVIALIGATAVLLRPRQPFITHNYLEEINAEALATPPEDRAWPRLYTAVLAMEPIPDFMTSRHWPFATDFKGQTPPTDEQWATAREFVPDHAESIQALRDAAAMPALGVVISDVPDQEYAQLAAYARGSTFAPESPSEDPWLLSATLPHISEIRTAANLLATDAVVAAQAGEARRATESLQAVFRLARLAASGPYPTENRAGLAIELLGHRILAGAMLARPTDWPPESLAVLDEIVQRASDRNPIVEFDGERLIVLDTIQRCYDTSGRMTAEGAAFLLPGSDDDEFARRERARVRKEAATPEELLGFLDRFIAAAAEDCSTPHWEREAWQRVRLHDDIGWEASAHKYAAVSTLTTLSSSLANACERLRQRRAASLAIIALARHRLRHGAFPETLDAIDPDLLPSPPLDRFTGEPLRWRLAETEAILYSIGNDRDDDNGAPIDDPDNLNWLPPGDTRSGRGGLQDGDWVLWRVPLE